MNRETVNSLLGKLGVENAAELSNERAEEKLAKRLAKRGTPEGLTDAEKALAAKLMEDDSDKGAGTEKHLYLLKIPGRDDRLEMITDRMAKTRNANRDDDNKWVPAPEGSKPPEKKDKDKPAEDKAEVKAAVAAAKENDKRAAKAVKKKATPAPAADKSDKGEKPKRKGAGGIELFKKLLDGGKKLPKAEVIEKLVAGGVSPGTASSYVVWSKRPLKLGKDKNPFGFKVEETKDEKTGKKFLQKIGK